MPITCPYCNKAVELNVTISASKPLKEAIYITRSAMAKDEVKPFNLRKYERLEYDKYKDRFLVKVKT